MEQEKKCRRIKGRSADSNAFFEFFCSNLFVEKKNVSCFLVQWLHGRNDALKSVVSPAQVTHTHRASHCSLFHIFFHSVHLKYRLWSEFFIFLSLKYKCGKVKPKM